MSVNSRSVIVQLRCPNWRDTSTTETGPSKIRGCGSMNTDGPDEEGLHDCLDCGIWFRPEPEHENRRNRREVR